MAEQEPVEKENIVELHATEHDKIPAKEAEKSKAVSDPVPRGKNGCGQKQQDRDPLYDPADDVRPVEPLFFVRDRVQILLRCGGKEPLILPTPPYKTRKYAAISRIAARIVTSILIPSF